MRKTGIQLLVLSVANSIESSAAFSMLQQDFMEEFNTFYEEQKARGGKVLTGVDALIVFTIRTLPQRVTITENLGCVLVADRDTIVERFIKGDVSELVTRLASRDEILEAIRRFLKKENKFTQMFAILNSNRVRTIFSKFLEMFHDSCAFAYRFEGTFIDFVMNCFIQFFYKGKKRDIWAMLRESDDARKEVEINSVVAKTLAVQRSDDLAIHDLLINISETNDLMFHHSGQSNDARGVKYDIYYLVLHYLCQEIVDEINPHLGEVKLKLEDPLDRRITRGNSQVNKGISAKICNAKEIVPTIFEFIRSGKLNTQNLTDLRDRCFSIGKRDREGRNCIWTDVVAGGETSRYLDRPTAVLNYTAFDTVLRGVISVYTLMKEFESHGMYLVNTYKSELFQDKDIIRYMDYISSLEHLRLIKELQAQVANEKGNGELFSFWEMVDQYAGSAVNNHSNIRANRIHVISRGFLRNPKLKQAEPLRTHYSCLQAVANYITAAPFGFIECIQTRRSYGVQADNLYPGMDIPPEEIVAGRYNNIYYNSIVKSAGDLADYFILGEETEAGYTSRGKESLLSLDWNIGTAFTEGLIFAGVNYSIYVPLVQQFFFYGIDGVGAFGATLEELLSQVSDSNGQVSLNASYEPPRLIGKLAGLEKKAESSMGFRCQLGIRNYDSEATRASLKECMLHCDHTEIMSLYYSQLSELSALQESLIDIMRILYTYTIYLSDASAERTTKERLYAFSVFSGLMRGEFESPPLTWMLNKIREQKTIYTMNWRDLSAFSRYALDTSILNCLYDTNVNQAEEGTLLYEFLESTTKATGSAERFVLLYNFINAKLDFMQLIRDSYDLLFGLTGEDIVSLNCELDARFKIKYNIEHFSSMEQKYNATIDSLDQERLVRVAKKHRDASVHTYQLLIDEIKSYLKESENTLSSLLDYSITGNQEIKSRFKAWGESFMLVQSYPDTVMLRELRSKATVDSAGFFLYNGSYFKGGSGGATYYVHKSGRLLEDFGKGLRPATFDFVGKEEDKQRYETILSDGFKRNLV